MKWVCNFSGGLCSFWSAVRLIERVGRQNVILLFADTLVEDKDLYEFNSRATDYLGIPLTRISLEMKPWDLFRREGLIGNNRFPICSTKLKREPLNEWMDRNYHLNRFETPMFEERAGVCLGFDHTEWHRVKEFEDEHPTWELIAPMTEPPLWDKCRIISESQKLGFKQPRLYTLGFPHNNCGGGCVRAGISHWVHLYRVLPHVYLDWEQEEQITIWYFRTRGIEPLTMLKDRRGGETKSLSLFQLRQRVEAGEKFDRNDWGGCGCGGATVSAEKAFATGVTAPSLN